MLSRGWCPEAVDRKAGEVWLSPNGRAWVVTKVCKNALKMERPDNRIIYIKYSRLHGQGWRPYLVRDNYV